MASAFALFCKGKILSSTCFVIGSSYGKTEPHKSNLVLGDREQLCSLHWMVHYYTDLCVSKLGRALPRALDIPLRPSAFISKHYSPTESS